MIGGVADSEPFALRAENARLRAALSARLQENETLLGMIGDVISTLGLEQVLRQIVAHLESSFHCNAAFVYLWEPARERLVLRGASERYTASIGRIQLGLDEGLVGWSARTGEPTMIPEGAAADPRFRYFPELEEERFQAMLTVPIRGPEVPVVAVIAMHTVAPREFTAEHVRVVAALAPILGSAIDRSRLYEQTSRKLSVLSTLSTLVQEVRSGRALEDALLALVGLVGQVTGAEACALIVGEPGLDQLSFRAYDLSGGKVEAPGTGAMPRRSWDMLAASMGRAGDGPSEILDRWPAVAVGGDRQVTPLLAAGQQFGLLCCARVGAPFDADDQALLGLIGGQAAIAVQNGQLAELLPERDLREHLFRDLRQGAGDGEELVRRRAALLGADLRRPHAPVELDLTPAAGEGGGRVVPGRATAAARRWLQDRFPGSLLQVETEAWALVVLPDEDSAGGAFSEAFPALREWLERETGCTALAGVGRICRTLQDYQEGFAQAREALRVARAVRPPEGVATFERLGAARYLAALADGSAAEGPRDMYQRAVEEVAIVDARKHAGLLETLAVFLAAGGNSARAAERLYVHRNTLVQRLDRLQELTGLDPRDSDHWLPLQIVLTLRRLGPAEREAGRRGQ